MDDDTQTVGEIIGAAAELPPSPLTIPLRTPIKYGPSENPLTRTEVTLREPTLGELDKVIKANPTIMAQMMALISELAPCPIIAVKQMSISDYNKCRDYLMSFINASA